MVPAPHPHPQRQQKSPAGGKQIAKTHFFDDLARRKETLSMMLREKYNICACWLDTRLIFKHECVLRTRTHASYLCVQQCRNALPVEARRS